MKPTKFIAVTALYTALLLAVQFALSGVGGIELVTVFFLSFCFCAGIKAGITVAVCFSLLRCFIFGFYPAVIILYLIYYSLFALFFGFLGKKFGTDTGFWKFIAVIVLGTAFTACFSLLDDIITPLFFGFTKKAALLYFYSSLPFMLSQSVCAAISIGLLFLPLVKVLSIAKISDRNNG